MFSQISASASTSQFSLFFCEKTRNDLAATNDEHVLSVQPLLTCFTHTRFDFGLKKKTTTGVFEILMLETGKLIHSIHD